MNKETIHTTDVRNFFKRWPRFYYFISAVFSQMMYCGLSSKSFLKKYQRSGTTLNLGSGPRILGKEVINIDMHPYHGVSVVADITSVPLADGSAGRVVCDNVLEHVKDPRQAVSEIKRLLARGGVAYISTPFLYPFHVSPNDYQRWTASGLAELFQDFEMVELGMRAGPFSTLTIYLCYVAATILSLGYEPIYWLLINLFMFVFLPVKLFDLILNYWPLSINMAAILFCVVRKR